MPALPPNPSRPTPSLRSVLIAIALAPAAIAIAFVARGADPNPADADLKALQGTWERTAMLPAGSGPQTGRVVKRVTGNRETVTTYDDAGAVTYAHAVEFRLERQGSVRVFTFFNRTITAGPSKGTQVPQPSSYIYRIRGDTFEEVWGFLPGQEERELLAARWRRVKRD